MNDLLLQLTKELSGMDEEPKKPSPSGNTGSDHPWSEYGPITFPSKVAESKYEIDLKKWNQSREKANELYNQRV